MTSTDTDPVGSEPSSEGFTIATELHDDQAVLRLSGALDVATAHQLLTAVDALPGLVRGLVLDLSDVTFIDSTGIGAVIRIRRALEVRFCVLTLRNPSERAQFVLDLTGLGPLIEASTPAL